jgi:hypothetical protein
VKNTIKILGNHIIFWYIFAESMGIITLTTDLGNQDFYAGLLKGKLLSLNKSLNIIDITHQINPFDIPSAAFQVRSILHAFPEQTIHIALVNAFEQNAVMAAVEVQNQWIIVPDNRMASMIMQTHVQEGYSLKSEILKDEPDLFSQIARIVQHLLDNQVNELVKIPLKPAQWFYPSVYGNTLRGMIIHIDRFGNCISNIHQTDFMNEQKNRRFELSLRNLKIRKIHHRYFEVEKGDAIAYFGLSGFLEIAIREANAGALLGIKVFDQFTIEFFND